MTSLRIRNVGPIKAGVENGAAIKFDGVTLFTGTQGSGKSTVAKLYSSLAWLEKSLQRGDLEIHETLDYEYFMNEVVSFHGLQSYFSEQSYVEYEGQAFRFLLLNKTFTSERLTDAPYDSPKIMYVPAERNFLAAIDRPELISKLPKALKAFLSEYVEAKEHYANEALPLSLGNAVFAYESESKQSFITGASFRVNLLHASSGYQSYVPLVIVTKYLSQFVLKSDKAKQRDLSVALEKRLNKELIKLFEATIEKGEELGSIHSAFDALVRRYTYNSFVNIVEEPEQNLFPTSQKQALFEVLRAVKDKAGNRLVITTHSPFIISYLNIAIQAFDVYERLNNKQLKNIDAIRDICPEASSIDPSTTNVYAFCENGSIEVVERYNGLVADDNQLNNELEETNQLFSELLWME